VRIPIVFDLETAAIDGAADFVPAPEPPPEPDLSTIQAARNLKDPAKVAADLEQRKAKAMQDHADKTAKAQQDYADKLAKASCDFNLARIVAIGYQQAGRTVAETCANEDEERGVLAAFWLQTKGYDLLGFCIRTFDVPMLMSRSRFLGVEYPRLDLSRYRRGYGAKVIDLWDELSFGLSDYDCTIVMSRKLKSYAKRYGLHVADDTNGEDIAAFVAAGEWSKVIAHVTSDVELTADLARKLGLLPETEQEIAEVF
jgi:hypothetical protein